MVVPTTIRPLSLKIIMTMSLRRLALATSAVVLIAASAAPALSQTPIDPLDARDARRLDRMEQVLRELRAIVFQGRDSGKPVVIQPAETDYQLQETARRLEDLEMSLTRVNGSLEKTTLDLNAMRRDNEGLKAQVRALTERITTLEQRQVAPVAPETPVAEAPAQSPAQALTQARQLMLGGDYGAAENAFSAFVSDYENNPKAPEARYWLGKTLTARQAHKDAALAYIGAIRGWPQTPWAPDAVVELARSLIAQKKPGDACQALDEFQRRYPKAAPAVVNRATTARTQAKCAA